MSISLNKISWKNSIPYSPSETDILLVPPVINPIYIERIEKFMPLGLMALAANLEKHNFTAGIFQPSHRLLNQDDYYRTATEMMEKNPKIIGFSTWCISYPNSLKLAETIKSLNPVFPVIFGGPQASILDRETLSKYSCVDYILSGEADDSLINLLDCLLNGYKPEDLAGIPGLSWRDKGGRIIKNEDQAFIKNLDSLPIPSYDKIPLKKVAKLDVGRGCPYKCTYCTTSSFFSRSYRVKSVSRVISEMDWCYEKAGIRSFGFAHDMFTLNKKYILNLCKSLIEHYDKTGRNYIWSCSSRPDCVSEDMLVAMKKAGCTDMFMGIESGSKRIQKIIKKDINIHEAYKIAKACSSAGIRMVASFMAGFPEETTKDLNDTIKAILEISARGAKPQLSLLSLLPGTPLYKSHKDKLKYDGRFSDFSGYVYNDEELNMIIKDPLIFSSFYYLPVKATSRDDLYSFSKLVNDLRDFPFTVKMIAPYLKDDIKMDIPFFEIVCKQMKKYRENKEFGYPELFCLVNNLYDYISYLQQNGLPEYVTDIFIMEMTKKSLLVKFIWKQSNKPELNLPGRKDNKINPGDLLVSTGNWEIITSKYQVDKILKKLKDNKIQLEKFRRVTNFYLVSALSEKKTNVLRLTAKQYQVMEKFSDIKVIDFQRSISKFMDEKTVYSWIRKMKKTGVIKIHEQD